jgi:hypothetical protein
MKTNLNVNLKISAKTVKFVNFLIYKAHFLVYNDFVRYCIMHLYHGAMKTSEYSHTQKTNTTLWH